MMRFSLFIFLVITTSWIAGADAQAADEQKTVKVYHDSDWTNNVESSEAIWRGMKMALSEVNYTVNGTRIEMVKKNHSGNVTRSLRNMKVFLSDPEALAIFAGMHSPPLITHRKFINENNIPVLVPWAAGGPITRHPSPDNSVFRLSVDDTKAGKVMVAYGVSKYNCQAPFLLLESTPWGDSNAKSITAALHKRGMNVAGVTRFSWGLKSHVASKIVQDVASADTDCVIMVAAASEGAQLALAMSQIEPGRRVPIISHWGITGGQFHELVDASSRDKIELSFIQTCFSFLHEPMSPLTKRVFGRLQSSYPDDIKAPEDIRSPVGLIHGYDLTKIFIAALRSVSITDDAEANRSALRKSLEALDAPVEGLIKIYKTPYEMYRTARPDAHEALGEENICMASYGSNNEIRVVLNAETL